MVSDLFDPSFEGGRSGSRGSKSSSKSDSKGLKKCKKGKFRPAGKTPMGFNHKCQTAVSKTCKKQVDAVRRRMKDKNAEDLLVALEENGLGVDSEGEVVPLEEAEEGEQGEETSPDVTPSGGGSPRVFQGPSGLQAGRHGHNGRMVRGRIHGGEIEGGEVEIQGGKRKLTAYNKFVRAFSMKHKGMAGKSLIRAAAKAWKKSPMRGLPLLYVRKRSHSKSR
jgi:hypothetical protein